MAKFDSRNNLNLHKYLERIDLINAKSGVFPSEPVFEDGQDDTVWIVTHQSVVQSMMNNDSYLPIVSQKTIVDIVTDFSSKTLCLVGSTASRIALKIANFSFSFKN